MSPPDEHSFAMIQADGLCKYYGEFAAAEDISFSVPAGQVCAFLGPNGAGKSTTMKMLTGYLSPNAGTAKIAGYDVHQDRIAAAECLGYPFHLSKELCRLLFGCVGLFVHRRVRRPWRRVGFQRRVFHRQRTEP